VLVIYFGEMVIIMNDFISIKTCSTDELSALLLLSAELKKLYKDGKRDICLAGKSLAMVFEKSSLRTRISFQVAMTDLGGNAIYLKPSDIGIIGKREPAKDMARVFSRYVDGIMARTFSHDAIIELAKYADVPVINALSDWSHPCQAMADLMTIQEHRGELKGCKIAYIGDGNNVVRSLAFACARFGMKLDVASPANYELDVESISSANDICEGTVVQLSNAEEAVKDATAVYTDTWVSMGQEDEKQKRVADFKGFQVNSELMSKAPADALVLHCLPAYRGLEITDEVTESKNSVIFDQAENRLHFQRALLKCLMSRA
jgi:ornithine carbamoyltransferase